MAITTTSVTAVYPMDSAPPTEWKDGLPVYDRAYNAGDLRRFMGRAVSDGVWTDYLDELEVSERSQTWYVRPGAAMAAGLLVDLAEEVPVIDQKSISSGQYAHVVLAARFDSEHRDAAVYAVVSHEPDHDPVRTDSVHELVLARIDWRGGISDLRMDNAMCGPVTAIAQPDTESFMSELRTAVSQFNLNVGEVTTQQPGSTPTVTVRRPEVAGGEVYIDFGIPRGPEGKPGRDGEAAPTMYISPEDKEPPRAYGNSWLVDDKATHTITALKCYETDRVHPGADTFPGAEVFPGGTGQWVPHKLSRDLFAD